MDTYPYVLLGGGVVAGYAAQAFVENGLNPGELAIISADNALPYDRPPLSKAFLAGKKEVDDILINPPGFYTEHGIDVRLNTRITAIDLQANRLKLEGGGEIGYGKLLIATGSRLRTLDLPGAGLNSILYLRSLDDSRRIRDQYRQGARAAVIGAGFIGMEVSSVLAGQGLETTLLYPDKRVWEKFFTPEMSAFFEAYYRERGVNLMPEEKVMAFEGTGQVSGVRLASGRIVSTDLVVAGIGVTPVIDLFEDSGLALDGGIVVNEYLETNTVDVYAAGDVAKYRDVIFDKHRRIEHWDNAVAQGKHAARVMMGKREPFVHVPYFFSDVFDLSYEYWGDSTGADRVVYRGEVADGAFSAWWLKSGRVIAAFAMNRPDEEAEAAQTLIKERREVSPDMLRDINHPLHAPQP